VLDCVLLGGLRRAKIPGWRKAAVVLLLSGLAAVAIDGCGGAEESGTTTIVRGPGVTVTAGSFRVEGGPGNTVGITAHGVKINPKGDKIVQDFSVCVFGDTNGNMKWEEACNENCSFTFSDVGNDQSGSITIGSGSFEAGFGPNDGNPTIRVEVVLVSPDGSVEEIAMANSIPRESGSLGDPVPCVPSPN